MSVGLHGRVALEDAVLIDMTSTREEHNLSYGSKLGLTIITRLNKIGKIHGISQRCTFVKEVKSLHLAIWYFDTEIKTGVAATLFV